MARQIRSVLLDCPLVRDASVLRHGGGYVASVVPSVGAGALDGEAAADRHVREWALVFDHRYRGRLGERADDPFAGWRSAYTGRPLPVADMAEWRSASVRRILDLRPRRILDLGCGTGLMASALVGRCERYCGTDASPAATARLAERLRATGTGRWEVRNQPAHDLDGVLIDPDAIVMNSVVQYFPSWAYLVDVLRRAIELVPGAGHVFLGDVRSLRLLSIYHTSVALARCRPDARVADVRRWIEDQARLEPELVIDPAAFGALTTALPRVTNVTVRPRRGRRRNEMSCFRYDVVLHVGEPPPPPAERRCLPAADACRLRDRESSPVGRGGRAPVAWAGLVDARVEPFASMRSALLAASPDATVREVRAEAARLPSLGVDPMAPFGPGSALDRDADVHVDDLGEPGAVLVVARPGRRRASHRGDGRGPAACCAYRAAAPALPDQKAPSPANAPLEERLGRRRLDLARRVGAYLAGRLPQAAGIEIAVT